MSADSSPPELFTESFTADETLILDRFFTNTNLPVFGIKNLPAVVKGALFARYSRSPKSLRRLFLDEFFHRPDKTFALLTERWSEAGNEIGVARAEDLYERVFTQYGDDSIAQLGAAHLACEQSSNILTKVIERGRLASYLEQSTRYIIYDQKIGGRYRYRTPNEFRGSPIKKEYDAFMARLFDVYSQVTSTLLPWLEKRYPRSPHDSIPVWRSTLRAKACDIARGLLPASTLSNVGIFADGQAFEAMLIRMNAHPLQEVQAYAGMMLTELRTLIPSFLRRVDQPERGVAWSAYFKDIQANMASLDILDSLASDLQNGPQVTLVDWDPDAETKLIAAALYEFTHLPDDQLLRSAASLNSEAKKEVLAAYCGIRRNRRHKPGRAFERVAYRFDLLSDYGVFRDLQRHRMLTIEWQKLTANHGYITPVELKELGALEDLWHATLGEAEALYRLIHSHYGEDVAQYAVPFAFRIRFVLQMNAREAIHLLELRSQQGGHSEYRRISQEMHRLIRDQAGHRHIAEAMTFVDYADYELERLASERAAERRALR